MGLDMYLTGKRYMSKYFNEGDEQLANDIAEKFPELKGKTSSFNGPVVKEISIEAGYWRKANAIHDWFVKNVQGGEDECKPHEVCREALQALKELCEQVLEDHKLASKLLPTTSGFFFGSTDYDKWYFEDLEQTIRIINDALDMPPAWTFEYRSSW